MSPEGKKLLNIVILGFGFMFMFTAFQTCGNIEVHTPDWSDMTWDNILETLTVLCVLLYSKQLSRASIALSSMGVDTQGEWLLMSLQPQSIILFYILF